MRLIIITLLLSLAGSPTKAQTTPLKDNSVVSYIDQMPGVVASAEIAYNLYYPKDKKNVYHQYETDIKSRISELAARSNHQSELLSMLSGAFDKESVKYDFTKIKVVKDKVLDDRLHDFNTDFFSTLDKSLRAINAPMNELSKQYMVGIPLAEKQLAIHREKIPTLLENVKNVVSKLDAFMQEKGYNKILDNSDTTHPLYIRLLEMRALMLDHILQVFRMIDGVNYAAAMTVETCRKYPEACK